MVRRGARSGALRMTVDHLYSERALPISKSAYTDTKKNVLFWAGARMSVIKLFLARKTIPFCGLNKTRPWPGILQGFLSTNLVYIFADRTFPRCSITPARNSPGILEIRWVYQFPAGTFPGCSLTPARNAPGSFIIRWVYLFPAWTFPGLFPSLAKNYLHEFV